MIELPIDCGEKAAVFKRKQNYYCDYCKKPGEKDGDLRWFSCNTLICNTPECWENAKVKWEEHCRYCDEQDRIREEHEKYINGDW